MSQLYRYFQQYLLQIDFASGLAPLLLRLYLAPVFMQAGYNKFNHFDSTVQWFGNSDWGLGLPLPELMVFLAAGTELVGGFLLIPGLAIRFIVWPLMVTMLVAIFAVHWDNGWLAISDASSWLANDRVLDAAVQKGKTISLLKEYGNYAYLTKNGTVTILNNGIEFGVTYFIMLLSLLFTGAGRFTSLDDVIARVLHSKSGV
jgi:uncharacterized membrane protein YphA (DoxX/SURF4 family)